MAALRRRRDYGAPLEVAEQLWYDPHRWASWVDGFGQVVHIEGAWPRAGSQLVWQSPPRGRGRVVERVVTQCPGESQESDVEDERLHGRQRVEFERLDGGVGVALSLDYRLKQGGPLAAATDVLFVRRALGESLGRTLERFGYELAAELA